MEPPLASTIARYLAGILEVSDLRSSVVTEFQGSLTITRSSSKLRTFPLPKSEYLYYMKLFMIFHTDSIGLRSGENAGQNIGVMFFSLNLCEVQVAV